MKEFYILNMELVAVMHFDDMVKYDSKYKIISIVNSICQLWWLNYKLKTFALRHRNLKEIFMTFKMILFVFCVWHAGFEK